MQELQRAEPERRIFVVDSAMEPKDEEEKLERAAFYASALLAGCSEILANHLTSCHQGALGRMLAAACTKEYSEWEFFSAVKELACVSVYLTVVDHGGEDAPEWLTDFLYTSLLCTDRMPDAPTARQIMEVHQAIAGYEICHHAAVSACHSLGLGVASEAAAQALKEFLEINDEYRASLLRFCLTQPLSMLHKHIESLL